VTKTQSAGPKNCLEHRATRVLHCTIVTRAAVLMFPLLLQTVTSNQMRPRRLRGAWFSRLLRHPARRRSGSILSPGTHTECTDHRTLRHIHVVQNYMQSATKATMYKYGRQLLTATVHVCTETSTKDRYENIVMKKQRVHRVAHTCSGLHSVSIQSC